MTDKLPSFKCDVSHLDITERLELETSIAGRLGLEPVESDSLEDCHDWFENNRNVYYAPRCVNPPRPDIPEIPYSKLKEVLDRVL